MTRKWLSVSLFLEGTCIYTCTMHFKPDSGHGKVLLSAHGTGSEQAGIDRPRLGRRHLPRLIAKLFEPQSLTMLRLVITGDPTPRC